ncbi:MAG: alpha-glucosidase [Brevundimonas sp.]|jgi:alpha-glucosidase|uniref:glycoside hydrolase family 97 protein n=1 Tax=Brevundimonas sp. TaxID=1871086 RepID=UPI0039E492FF
MTHSTISRPDRRQALKGVLAGVLAPLASLAPTAWAQSGAPARVTSPDGALAVEVTLTNEGRPAYSVTRFGQSLITESRLGFILADAAKLERGLQIAAVRMDNGDETWEQPWGERRFVRDHFNEMRVTLREGEDGRRFDVVFRVHDEGVGFRYEFPQQAALARLAISQELTEFTLAESGTTWWLPAMEWNRAEYLYNRTPIEEAGVVQTPITFRLDSGVHLALHEAALVDYAGMNLQRVEGRRFRAALTPGIEGAPVVRAAPFATPWRAILVADSAAALAESNLILNLNAPNALGDVSWFKPMKYVGVWWEMHLDQKTWNAGPRHGATTENAIRHIDFAAEHGFGGVLVEGWNVGWDGQWFGNGWDYSFTRPYPDFDLERVAAHAREKGVQIVGHHETGGNAYHYERQLEDAFALCQRLGIGSVKTGYVADAGGAQVAGPGGRPTFAWHESQVMARHHQRVIETAARYQVAINAHEPIKDTGLRRTWPNFVSREGARGMEYNAWGQPGNPPEHEPNLVFTRMLAGPFDFTPGVFGMETRAPDGVATTWAKQLALYVVIYSPLQMAADLLVNYEANPGPFQFIKDVAVDWEHSHVLNGEVGDYVTIARKDRNSDEWFLGSVTDEHGRVLSAPLSFLDADRRYRAEIYRDAPDAHWRTNREAIVIETLEVAASDVLDLRLAPGGGQAVRFVPL